MKQNIWDELFWRGLINQSTDAKELKKRLEKPIVVYGGFDVTADSLHIGHLLPMITLKRFAQFNHQIIPLLGDGTSLIGDPSGKKSERQLNPEEQVEQWAIELKKQLEKIFDEEIHTQKATILQNSQWLKELKLLPFIRNIGKHFSLGYMLAKESVKSRLESGISFTEFSYMLLQAYDYFWLNEKFNCELQIGGSDQWGNITSGIDLITKTKGKTVYGLTLPLLLKSDGTKFGKTEGGTVWLNPQKTSAYQFYQYFINVSDDDVIRFLKYFSFLSNEEIQELEKQVKNNPEKRQAPKTLAQELTKLVHGETALKRAEKISEALFSNQLANLSAEEIKEGLYDVPTYTISQQKEISIVDLLVNAQICPSKRQAREDIENHAISLNGQTVADVNLRLTPQNCLVENIMVLRRGKKNYYLIYWQ
ncbi:MAG: tyrosine--tRNA ligase [Candidatus Pacebacteria bacterium]|nr:tyrosine--tRNA ligase [Candidatus Paceibacterota bacterium]